MVKNLAQILSTFIQEINFFLVAKICFHTKLLFKIYIFMEDGTFQFKPAQTDSSTEKF